MASQGDTLPTGSRRRHPFRPDKLLTTTVCSTLEARLASRGGPARHERARASHDVHGGAAAASMAPACPNREQVCVAPKSRLAWVEAGRLSLRWWFAARIGGGPSGAGFRGQARLPHRLGDAVLSRCHLPLVGLAAIDSEMPFPRMRRASCAWGLCLAVRCRLSPCQLPLVGLAAISSEMSFPRMGRASCTRGCPRPASALGPRETTGW